MKGIEMYSDSSKHSYIKTNIFSCF